MAVLDELRDIIQVDVGNRGLRRDPERNLINACPDDFRLACHSIADHPRPVLAIVTGFYIPTATPPAGETDGPLGALFLARALHAIGIDVVLLTDGFCFPALHVGRCECGLKAKVGLWPLPDPAEASAMTDEAYRARDFDLLRGVTHLLAIERVGPNQDGRCYTMRGRDITDVMSPAHRLFEGERSFTTIGVGDGGNEIGMGKIPRDVIARNIPNGELVACRTATDHCIVAGISNWGGYALAAGVAHLRGKTLDASLFDPDRERAILDVMVKRGPLVDGVTGQPTATVDGLTWEQYAEVLVKIGAVIGRR